MPSPADKFSVDPTDALILVIVGALSIAFLALSYWIAGPAWKERHTIKTEFFGQAYEISGFWGEALIALAGGGVFLWVDGVTPDARFHQLFPNYPLSTSIYGILSVFAYLYYAHSVLADARAKESHRGIEHYNRLKRTYIVYAPCALIIYCASAAAMAMLALQYLHNTAAIAAHSKYILLELKGATAGKTPDDIQTAIEVAYGDILNTGNSVASSMAPIFGMMAAIFGLVILVTATPLKSVLLKDSRNVTRYSGIVLAALIFALTTLTYYFSYSGLLSDCLQAIAALRPSLAHARWEILERFNTVFLDLQHKQSFVGFVAMVANESGMAVIAVALFQWLLSGLQPFLQHHQQASG